VRRESSGCGTREPLCGCALTSEDSLNFATIYSYEKGKCDREEGVNNGFVNLVNAMASQDLKRGETCSGHEKDNK
jgi:hypothetical protein